MIDGADDRRPPAGGLGFAVTVDLHPRIVRQVAGTVARLGYRSLWVNTGDGEHADGLAVLRLAHEVAPQLVLGVGVIALHRIPPAGIVDRVRASGLPLDRLRLGIGSGTSSTPLSRPVARVRSAITEIRAALPGAHLVIAALGPAMCRLGGEVAEGVLLNWMPPGALRWAVGEIDRGTARRARPGARPAVLAYVRAATGPDALPRLSREASRYRRAGAHYESNAERTGPWPGGVDLSAASAPAEIAAYRDVLDEVVLRALPAAGTAGELEEIAGAGMDAAVRAGYPGTVS